MKKLFTLLAIVLAITTFAQEFSGKATYLTKQSFEKLEAEENPSAESVQQFNEAMQKASEKTFFLEFTKEESLYTEEISLEQPTNNSISISYSSETDGKLYKNLKENYSLLESDLLGKTLLIKDTLHNLGWTLLNESKKIGNYTVYKASKTVAPVNLLTDNEDEETISFLAMIDEKYVKPQTYYAWYTPEIAIPNGPEKFGGLPGLILELHTPNRVYLCSEVILNPKKTIKIKPLKGKLTTQNEFNVLLKELINSVKNGNIIKTEKSIIN